MLIPLSVVIAGTLKLIEVSVGTHILVLYVKRPRKWVATPHGCVDMT